MKIHLPNSAFLGNIDPFLRSYDPSEEDRLEITSNDKWVFVHPVVLAMVEALSQKVHPSKITCDTISAKSGHYLTRMGLLKRLKDRPSPPVSSDHDSSGRFIPISKITNSQELTRFITEMIPLLHLDPKHVDSVRYVVSELVRNVLEHAETKEGAMVSAQYYKKSNAIKIGIVDAGVGIKKSINYSYNAAGDLEAIKLALTPGVTGTTKREGGTEFNAGAGLFFIKSIAKVNRSFFIVYSGNAMYKLLKRGASEGRALLYANPNQDKHSERSDLPYWKGTAVGIDISLDATNEFTELLELIKRTYTRAVTERRKERYKRAQFI